VFPDYHLLSYLRVFSADTAGNIFGWINGRHPPKMPLAARTGLTKQ
jgi:hypothetical protein